MARSQRRSMPRPYQDNYAHLDAVQNRAVNELMAYVANRQAQGITFTIGELGWPTNQDNQLWDAVGEHYLRRLDVVGVTALYWSAGRYHSGNTYQLAVYQSPSSNTDMSQALEVARILESHPSTGTMLRGVNVQGGENKTIDSANEKPSALPSAGGQFSNLNPGNYGTADYCYPTDGDMAYLASRGVKLIRMCFVWERVQPTFQQVLSSIEVTRIKAALTSAHNHGIQVVLAAFNRQGYVVGANSTTSQFIPFSISQTVVTQAAFSDFWSRMATVFTGTPGLYAYEPCSEPIPPPDATVTGSTLVTNGGFETGTGGWTVTGGTTAIDTINQHSGSQCLQVTATGGAPVVVQSSFIPITYSSLYYAVGWLKLISTSLVGAAFEIQIDWYSASGSYITTAGGNAQSSYGGVPSVWNFSAAVSPSNVPPSTATQCKLKIYTSGNMNANDVVCLDDIGLWQATQCWTRQKVWETLSQGAVSAIRSAGDTSTQIWVATWNGDLANAVYNHPTWWITDPNNNTVETVHHYWNHTSGALPGPYTASYSAEITADRNAGY